MVSPSESLISVADIILNLTLVSPHNVYNARTWKPVAFVNAFTKEKLHKHSYNRYRSSLLLEMLCRSTRLTKLSDGRFSGAEIFSCLETDKWTVSNFPLIFRCLNTVSFDMLYYA